MIDDFDSPVERELVQRVNAAMTILDELNPDHGEALRLHDVDGLTSDEVAVQLDVPEETVRGRILLGRQFVRAMVFTKPK